MVPKIESFPVHKSAMDFSAILDYANKMRTNMQELVEAALNDGVTESDAKIFINQIKTADISVKTAVDMFSSMHTGDIGQKTLKEALGELSKNSTKNNLVQKL